MPGSFIKIFVCLAYFSAAEICLSQQADSSKAAKTAAYIHIPLEAVKANLITVYKNISGMRITGDVENDFSSAMIEYHSAIAPALESEIDEGRDSLLISLARRIRKRHDDLSEILKTYLGKVKVSQVNKNNADDVTGSIKQDLSDIITDISGKISQLRLQNKQDEDFASLIRLHNEGTLSLAENYLEYGEDVVLRKIVEKMIDENEQDFDLIENHIKDATNRK